MIKAVVFDCFGVLTEDGWHAFLHAFASEDNTEELRYLNHQVDKGLLSYQDFLTQICELTNASQEEAHRIITTQLHPNTPLLNFVKQLKTKEYALGIISNVGGGLDEFIPKEYLDLFDCITLSYQVGSLKPAPRIYEAHLEQAGLMPEETVFVDDRQRNVEGAEAVGMKGVLYRDFNSLTVELSKLGVE